MAAADLPPNIADPMEKAGFIAFFEGLGWSLESRRNDKQRRGWWLAHRRAYAEGVKAGMVGDDSTDNPYPEFSCAREAWADGYSEETTL